MLSLVPETEFIFSFLCDWGMDDGTTLLRISALNFGILIDLKNECLQDQINK